MENLTLNDLEIAPKSVVLQTARLFSKTLADTPQFQEFEESYQNFRQDLKTQKLYQELQKKQESLRVMAMLSAVSEKDRTELENLQKDFYRQKSVSRYLKAQEDLISICQEVGDLLSKSVGLDFGSSCRVGGCCG